MFKPLSGFVIVSLALCVAAYAQRAPISVPTDLHEGHSRDTNNGVTFCIDDRTYGWEADFAIAQEIAQALLVEADFYRLSEQLESRPGTFLGIPEPLLFVLLDDHCDAILGMPIGPRISYPDFLTFTAPYQTARFVIASPDEAMQRLDDFVGEGAAQLGVSADSPMYGSILYYQPDVRLRVYGGDRALYEAVRGGEVDAGVFLDRIVAEFDGDDLEAERLSTSPVTGVPDAEWSIAMAMLSQEAALRELLSEGIRAVSGSDSGL